jgi:SPX domain protein involved in polyphosphate accumulation
VDVQGLVDFIEINKTGFRKALKKHDKVLGALPGHDKLSAKYMPKVEASFPDKSRLHLQVTDFHMWKALTMDPGTS